MVAAALRYPVRRSRRMPPRPMRGLGDVDPPEMSISSRRVALGAPAVVLALALLAAGCRGCGVARRDERRMPIVLITLDALRADAVGAFGGPRRLTPALDRLAAEATWAGPAISP